VNFLASLAIGLLHAIERVAVVFERPAGVTRALRDLGWDVEISESDYNTIVAHFAFTSSFLAAENLFEQLETGSGDPIALAGQLLATLQTVIGQVRAAISSPPTGLPTPFNDPAFWSESLQELVDRCFIEYFQAQQPLLLAFLSLIGFVKIAPASPAGASRKPYQQQTLDWDKLAELLSDPEGAIASTFGWGGVLDVAQFATTLQRILNGLRLPVRLEPLDSALAAHYYSPGNPALATLQQVAVPIVAGANADATAYAEFGVIFAPIPANGDTMGAPVGFAVAPLAFGDLSSIVAPSADERPLGVSVGADFTATGSFAVEVRPDAISLNRTGSPTIDASLTGTGQPAQPWILIGDADGSRLEISGFLAGIHVRGSTSGVELIFQIGAVGANNDTTKGATLVIDFSNSDGFLQSLLGGANQSINLSALVQYSSQAGISIAGQAKLRADIPLQLSIAGVLDISRLTIALAAGTGSGAALQLAISGGLTLGPFEATVDRIGVEADITPLARSDPPGNLDRLNLGFAFKPPNGLGIEIDAGVVTGGGYISFDPIKGQYAGVAELSLAGIVTVKAIGVLDTKLPNGEPGFSFLLILTTDFPPIQLSFGFTLNGVGGLCGINRTMSLDNLRAGLRAHHLDSVLFPPDPIANAPQIISDVESFFPPQQDRYVFGPMLEVGWGTPTIIVLEVGVVLEIPDPVRLAILGLVACSIPDPDVPLIELHIDVLGTIDFDAGKLAIDGSLYDSNLLLYSLSGDMALRLDWGDNPNFLVSFGGFNPRFQPPSDVPAMHRMTVSFGVGDNPCLSSNSYFAVTSNSLQFGANVDAYAAAGGFSVHGYIGFDTLFIFSPFSFTIDFSAGFDISYEGTSLAGIHLDATISGPTPWHLHGDASFNILFFDVSASIDLSWGDSTQAVLPSAPVLPPLLAALGDPRNWSSALPDQTSQSTTLAKPPPGALIVHPMGSLSVRETIVPLDITITKFGNAAPADGNYFAISGVTVDGEAQSPARAQEYFAIAQFTDMSDADKISAPSYELFDAGFSLGGPSVVNGHDSPRTVTYEERYIDDYQAPSRFGRIYAMPANVHSSLVRSGASFRSSSRTVGMTKYVQPGVAAGIAIEPTTYVIASATDLTLRADVLADATNRYEAMTALQTHLAAHPEELGDLTILASYEVPV
jgi:Family of unknown function (DUF6603)